MAPGRLAELSSPAPRTSLFSRRAPAEPEMPTEVWIAKQPAATGGAEWRCLTQALYFEARGEGFEGVVGVAEVILNRVESPRFPDSVCAVVNQGTGQQNACQFSFACDGRPEHVSETRTYEHLGKIARAMIDGAPRMFTGGATYFHTTGVNPRWALTLDQTTQIGDHKFYR
ncbi:cell wall hydrolase [Maritimibacter sp. DP1N21-5]|nr:cell wall hydrolase [Maritimibacter sp. DP1N21-5]